MDKQELEAAVTELHTLRDMLRWSMSQFNAANIYYGHGTDNAWDEALYLALNALHLPPDVNPAVIEARLTQHERQAIVNLIQRRVTERIPAAYLTQQAWFAGLPFYIDQRVLVPRSPLAELIEKRFAPWISEEQPLQRILDIGTGSGCIAIACAVAIPEAKVDAADISKEALAVAEINVKRHQLEDRVRLIQSDVFSALPGQIYDLITSNPPYVGTEELSQLPREYQHEPKLGLAAGESGLDIVQRILRDAHKHLTPEGLLIVEVGNSETALVECFPNVPFTWLEFERGGGGVFMLTAEQLEERIN